MWVLGVLTAMGVSPFPDSLSRKSLEIRSHTNLGLSHTDCHYFYDHLSVHLYLCWAEMSSHRGFQRSPCVAGSLCPAVLPYV